MLLDVQVLCHVAKCLIYKRFVVGTVRAGGKSRAIVQDALRRHGMQLARSEACQMQGMKKPTG